VIVKHLSRKSNSAQLIKYVLRYVLNEKKTGVPSNQVITHNLRGNDINSYINDFKENEKRRIRSRKNNVLLHHVILSWSSKDKENITDTTIQKIAKHYISLRGKNNLYLGAQHLDKNHLHLHLITSGSQINGRSNRMSRNEFAKLKLDLDAFQQTHFPELSHSLPSHGTKQLVPAPVIDKRNGRLSQKEQIQQAIHAAYGNANSQASFESALHAMGYTPYTRTGVLTGILLESGRKYRFRSLGLSSEKLDDLHLRQHQLSELHAIRCRSHERNPELKKGNDQPQKATVCELDELTRLRSVTKGARGIFLEQ